MTPEKLEELERLLKAATPGPWEYAENSNYVMSPIVIHWADIDAGSDGEPHDYGKDVCEMCDTGQEEANAALICAAINALPELVARVRDYAKLNEPDGVLINMMRGTIPKVSANSLHKLYSAAEVSEAFPELRAVKAALEEIARHENTGLTGPGRQQADSCVNIARAALEGFNCG